MRTIVLAILLTVSVAACNHDFPRPSVISSEVAGQIDRAENLLDQLKPAAELCMRNPSKVCNVFTDSYARLNAAVVVAKKLVVVGNDAIAIASQLTELGRRAADVLQSFASLSPEDAPDAG